MVDAASTTILKNKLRLFGHVLRRNVPLHDVILWEPQEFQFKKRIRGGRRRALLDDYLLLFPSNVQRILLDRAGKSNQRTITGRGVRAEDLENMASGLLQFDDDDAFIATAEADRRHAYRALIKKAAENNNNSVIVQRHQVETPL
jgi:hypothetical protein